MRGNVSMMRDIEEIEERYRNREARKGKINILKKRYVIILVLLIAFITNPSEDKHQQVVKSKINEVLRISVLPAEKDEQSGYEFDNVLVDQIVDSYTSYNNYFLFSTTDVIWKGKTDIIGIGLFGYVFIPGKVDEILLNYKP